MYYIVKETGNTCNDWHWNVDLLLSINGNESKLVDGSQDSSIS